MSEPLWRDGPYLIASGNRPLTVHGWTYGGLGMVKSVRGSPKGKRAPWWTLIHLGSGHRVCIIEAHMIEAFDIATEIADCGDWDWEGLEGYRNKDPELLERVSGILAKHGKKVHRFGNVGDPEGARAIAEARA